MSNPLGSPLSPRPTEGYAKSIQTSDPQILDGSGANAANPFQGAGQAQQVGNPVLTEVGDAQYQAVRVAQAAPANMMPPEATRVNPDPTDYLGRVVGTPVPGERGEGMMAFDRQGRALLELIADRLHKQFLLTLYMAQGGMIAGGQTPQEFLAAMGLELNPLDMGEVPASEGQMQPMGDR